MRKKLGILMFIAAFALASVAFAATTITLDNPLQADSIQEVISGILSWLAAVGAPIAAGMIVYGAFLLMFSAGNPEKVTTGKKTILYTVIGYAIILIGNGIIKIIENLVNK